MCSWKQPNMREGNLHHGFTLTETQKNKASNLKGWCLSGRLTFIDAQVSLVVWVYRCLMNCIKIVYWFFSLCYKQCLKKLHCLVCALEYVCFGWWLNKNKRKNKNVLLNTGSMCCLWLSYRMLTADQYVVPLLKSKHGEGAKTVTNSKM